MWVDAFHAGIRTPEEAAQLVADAKRAYFNTLLVQVRRRGDALYLKSFEPPMEDAAYDPEFDALAHILELAHREGLEVHAWINAMPIWRDPPDISPPPKDPRHVFNRHGPSKSGEDDWLTATPGGEKHFPVGYFLDPGHPAAADYLTGVYLTIIQNYAVDGIHLDYIRYPETADGSPPDFVPGYNPTSLARFRRATGRVIMPAPDDPSWMDWRRRQVTDLVRRVYIEAKAVNPRLKVSAAVVPWGKPPTSEKDFEQTHAMQRVFQDWHGWLQEGILDLAFPMNYAAETDAAIRGRFNGWIRWEKRHKHDRQLVIGIGAYLNTPQVTLAQVRRARRSEGRRRRAAGVAFFSYANFFARPEGSDDSKQGIAGQSNGGASLADRMTFIFRGAPPEKPVFTGPAPVPAIDWIVRPKQGWLAGKVLNRDDEGVDGARVSLQRAGWWPFRGRTTARADGNGFFGFVNLKPGRYRLRLEWAGRPAVEKDVEIAAGRVTRAELRHP